MAAPVVDAEYLKEIERARRDLRALISSKNCAPIMLRLAAINQKKFHQRIMGRDFHLLSADELRTLIRGVRMYGSERWNDIQQRYFSDEEHLTIDELKETWKNLVKMAKNHKRRVDHLPKEIWAQVQEADR